MQTVRVGVAGATGYAGQELLAILSRHPRVSLTAAMSSGTGQTELPRLAGVWDGRVEPLSIDQLADVAAVFLALPDPITAEVAPALVARGVRVFDLSGTFRLRDAEQRAKWYPPTPDEAATAAVYGLPEHHREALPGASLVACPGCYPTAAILALRPLVTAGLLTGDLVVDAKSGISGAGKTPSERTHFSASHGNVAAYKVFTHRHTAEIEQELQVPVTFVPHLVPLDRGILETIYARVRPGAGAREVEATLRAAYDEAAFVRLRGATLPEIRDVVHTNFCDIGWSVHDDGRLVVVACLDNLVKGAAGQAVQAFNIAFGLDERDGLR
ncbi:MAG: N-acetyl-gamma-glutamyl-phosphate reductase [Vicinamibacterales bacterium]|jgi:N-acetyl-gamma-glutamyl-phosphate reductase|nr:N-acetyl-gamma-glutamyl-phosphate reductase [Acidobacteriota bacterium]MDP7472355.1 N-acetyl-gamma-glutamyl-phosphate reductase [Vicinamibacterales bacterium]MDP7670720.1 N-acetyl-gamma-glutamyl-phosphate reductase [Vicinamibacterales bacterium]HJO38997.1 N-acetyl-gamma-glutamyl-phosphate reductase [Vicinamibacterales bacterium]|tara:strand:- start:1150 stop:2130 length:981 start_codon:yes stop_codon:yes gene_type:complete